MIREQPKERIRRMLEGDKEEMNEASRAAALKDFAHVAAEYFELDGAPVMRIAQGKRASEITVSFRAVRVKNFTTLKH